MKNNKKIISELKKIEKREDRIRDRQKSRMLQENIDPLLEKVEAKIPPKLEASLKTAFLKSFTLVFDKGLPYIEKTINDNKIKGQHCQNNEAVENRMSRRHFRKMKRSAGQGALVNQSLSAVEGGALGILGIGIPDIPIFIAMILRTLSEIASHFGYPDKSDAEKCYMLLLICGAMTKDARQADYDENINKLGQQIDTYDAVAIDLTDYIEDTSAVLSKTLLTTKFIQGLPIVGIIGGLANPFILNKISVYAELKYQKRYLAKKLQR
ncbi:EcsC family protein [Eubacteriaceae bacterium ES2]|nr:EcsC family protein [Eubacteriaceae bacterium ES2]